MKSNIKTFWFSVLLKCLFMICFINCSKPPELNGNWIVKAFRYKGNYLYPNTIRKEGSLIITIDEQYREKIIFDDYNKFVKLPGINSSELTLWYKIKNDSIEFLKLNPNDYANNEYEVARDLYLNKFEIRYFKKEGIVELTRDNTIIQIISEELLLNQKLNRILRP